MQKENLNYYFSTVPKEKQKAEVIAYLASLDYLSQVSPIVAWRIIQELKDQRSYLKLIASENFSSIAVQLAMGNLLTDKYSEGFPHHRFYAGCENVDVIEEEAAEQAKSVFKVEHAYVQPHSGADANLVAIWTVLTQKIQNRELENLGKKSVDELTSEEYEKIRQALCSQTLLGLSLDSGGHLTHGYRHNISSKMMRAENYHVDPKTGLLNYDTIREQARKYKPLIIMAGYSSYPRLINFAKMREIADEVGAVLMCDMAHFAGLVAGKVFKGEYSPSSYAHIISSTTHKTLRGPRGGFVLCNKEFADTLNKGCPLVLGGPLPQVMAAKAIAFKEASLPAFSIYAEKIVENAKKLAETLMQEGVPVTTGGTDNHLLVIDLTNLGLTGRQAETALREARMTANRNMIPGDPNGPWYTTGVRIGTPAITTLGMGKEEMVIIGKTIAKILKNSKPAFSKKTQGQSKALVETDPKIHAEAQETISGLLCKFPLYPEILLAPETVEFSEKRR